jgi:hypothetical protein
LTENPQSAIQEEKSAIGSGIALLVGSWFVPGLGFIVKRNYWRGVVIFLLLNATFLIGLLLQGTVIMPDWRYWSPGFNVVNCLVFIGQMGNAGAGLLSWIFLTPDQVHLRIFQPNERGPWFDLATLYLLVSGCLNYFCVCNFYDRYLGSKEAKEKVEGATS